MVDLVRSVSLAEDTEQRENPPVPRHGGTERILIVF